MTEYHDIPPFARDFLMYQRTIKGMSKSTVYEYYLNLRVFFRFLKIYKNNLKYEDFDLINVNDISVDFIKKIEISDLYEFLFFIDNENKNSPRTRSRKISCIRSFFKYLYNNANLIDSNPAAKLEFPKIEKTLPRYLELDESIKLLETIGGKSKERDYAIILLFLSCGMRLSELVSINIGDVRKDTLIIKGKGNKERTVYLSDACLNAIEAYLRVRPADGVLDKNALFLSKNKKRICNRAVQDLVKKYIKAAGLDDSKYSVHKLRHTAATLMYKEGGVDVRLLQHILGHEQLSTTEIYTHIDDAQLKAAVNKNPISKIYGADAARDK